MTPAHDTVCAALRHLGAATLDQVMDVADLQTRVDRKYLVPTSVFAELIAGLSGRLRVLDIGGRRLFDYESVYFDTPDLLAHHQHAHGRRRRFKVRTRTYLDARRTMLEVKTQGGRQQTVKNRHPYQFGDRYLLTAAARDTVARQLGARAVAEQLEVSLVNRYHRATLVDLTTGARMTCDIDLDFRHQQRHHRGPEDRVLIESKTAGAAAPADTLLWRLGHRPAALSKYCVGQALLHPDLPANTWNRTLRRHFGWTPHRDGVPANTAA